MNIAILVVLLLLSLNITSQQYSANRFQADAVKYASNIAKAVNYLTSHVSNETNLIIESEDSGTSWLNAGEYKNNFEYTYSQVSWVWSDNGFAVLALEPWNPTLSQTINRTIQSYNANEQGEFLTVTGIPIQQYHEVTDTILLRTANYAVVNRNYNGVIITPNLNFADEALYYALSEFEKGNVNTAQQEVLRVDSWWNTTCLVDGGVTPMPFNGVGAPSDSGWCPSNRLGLLLFSAEVVGVTLPNGAQIEEAMWSHQNANGGIASLATGSGTPSGSANCESTSTSLLPYNSALVQRIQVISAQHRNSTQTPIPEFPSTLMAVVVITSLLLVVVARSERRHDVYGSRGRAQALNRHVNA